MYAIRSYYASFSNVFKLVAGDFNHDGLTDVASMDWGTQSHDVDVGVDPIVDAVRRNNFV